MRACARDASLTQQYPSFSAHTPRELRGVHRHGVRALAWNADGHALISCGPERNARVWQSERGNDMRASRELVGHKENIAAIACDPAHPELVATGSDDKSVRLWDIRSAKPVKVVSTPGSNINLAFHPEGRYLVAGDKNETVSLIDTAQGKIAHTIKNGMADRQEINELAWSPDGSLLLLPMGNGSVSFLRAPKAVSGAAPGSGEDENAISNWERVLEQPSHPAAIFCIQWDPSARYVATAAADSTIALWEAADWTNLQVFSSLKYPARTLGFSHDGEWLASGGEDSEVSIVRMASTMREATNRCADVHRNRARRAHTACSSDNQRAGVAPHAKPTCVQRHGSVVRRHGSRRRRCGRPGHSAAHLALWNAIV